MRLFALVGASGTGKSYISTQIAQKYKLEYIIDDGLLISNNKIIAGTSAKKEKTKMASVKHAVFIHDAYAQEMKNALKNIIPSSLLILGTSEKMVKQIAERLDLPEFNEILKIEDVSTPEKIQLALENRNRYGKHVIPVPTFELKQDFSGYFLRALKVFQKKLSTGEITQSEKTIIRPTYSYLGEYSISDNVISDMFSYEIIKSCLVYKINSIKISKLSFGIGVDITLTIEYGSNLQQISKFIKTDVVSKVCDYTSLNIEYVNITIRNIVV